MKKALVIFLVLFPFSTIPKMSWALPDCVASAAIWNNCFGTYEWTSGDFKGDKYVGEWKDNNMHGQGTYYNLADNEFKGDRYVGEWKDGKTNGQGTYYHNNGSKYVGGQRDDERHGQGTYTYADGSKDAGEWKNGKLNGYAIQYNADGSIKREGIFKDGKFLYEEKRSESTSSSSGNSESDNHKEFCKEIGFIPGTEKFGDCVMKLMDKD